MFSQITCLLILVAVFPGRFDLLKLKHVIIERTVRLADLFSCSRSLRTRSSSPFSSVSMEMRIWAGLRGWLRGEPWFRDWQQCWINMCSSSLQTHTHTRQHTQVSEAAAVEQDCTTEEESRNHGGDRERGQSPQLFATPDFLCFSERLDRPRSANSDRSHTLGPAVFRGGGGFNQARYLDAAAFTAPRSAQPVFHV